MKAIDRPFTQIINGAGQFVIPVFQRDYSWTEEQCTQLWDDIVHISDRTADGGHFLGSVVYVPTGDNAAGFNRWMLIDGQQRLTTLTVLLTALRDYIRDTKWAGGENDPTESRVDAYYLKNLQEDGARRQKLVLRRHDQATLSALIAGSSLPPDPSERLVSNYEFFLEKIAEADPSAIYRGIGRLVVVDVTLDRATDDPQLVFESLNSTGVDLSQADLIRNFVLMRLPEAEQTALYEKYWSAIEALFRGSEQVFDAFARDFLAVKTRANKQQKADEIYSAFRRFFPELKGEAGSLDAFLGELLRFARYHAAFSIGTDGWDELQEPLARLRKLVDVPAILIMRLFDCYDRLETLSEADFCESIAFLRSYVLRRAVCGLQTRGYWQVFANMAHRLDVERPAESLRVALARQRENYRFPDDEEFRRELRERDLYGLRVCSHLLEQLENHGSREKTDTTAYSIEHIMPQNKNLSPAWREMLGDDWKEIQQSWLHRLGNLTLTGYNSTYSDRPFGDKKSIDGGFEDSSVRLNRYVREQDVWTEAQISERGAMLADRALEIWPSAPVDQALIDAAEEQDKRELAARRDVSKVSMSKAARAIFEPLQERIFEMASDVIEVAEKRSVSYHGPSYFLEVLPRKHRLLLLLDLDFNEIEDPEGIAEDATQWKFLFYAQHDGGVTVNVTTPDEIEVAMPLVRQAYVISGT